MFDNMDHEDSDYPLWQRIAEYMHGETALVVESGAVDGCYVFLGLKDAAKNKELFYMMEQDNMTGVYIDDREEFDRDWDSGEYEHEGCFYLEPECLVGCAAGRAWPERRIMKRLTWEKENGEWGLNGYDIKQAPGELYGALCRLHEYEKSGLSPDQLEEVDRAFSEQAKELMHYRELYGGHRDGTRKD